jgi:NAD(P)-dependent dehydrogenase (short-subunit alcohol dehydrogenase family)
MHIAIVTGGSSGIGQSAAKRIAADGSGVILTYHRNADGAHETVAEIHRQGGTAVALPLDLDRTDTFGDFRATVSRTLAETWNASSFTQLVNNAGFGEGALFDATSEDLFDHLYRGLLKGPYFLTQRLAPMMSDGGAVVFTGSTAAVSGTAEPGYSAYATMKGGIVVMTRYLAKELSERGIRVNSVAPGVTRTRLGDDAFARMPELIPPIAARTAFDRIGEPDDIGNVIAFLVSDGGSWITGQTIEASGGYDL